MARAVTSRETVAYAKESTWGVIPAIAFTKTRYASIQPKQDKQTVESQEINGNRAIADMIPVSMRGGLTLPFEMSYGVIDDFAETLFGNAWATNVLKVGSTRKSVVIERQLNDISTFYQHRGAVATKLDFTVATGRIIGGSWEFASFFPDTTAVTAGTGAVVAAPTGQIMNPISHVQLLQEGATPLTGVSECSVSIVNNVMDFDEVGNINPVDFGLGEIRASGKVGLYAQDASYFTKFKTDVLTSMAVTIGGASATKYAWLFNSVRLKAYDLPNQGKNNKVVQMFEWEAIDDATNSLISLTRTP